MFVVHNHYNILSVFNQYYQISYKLTQILKKKNSSENNWVFYEKLKDFRKWLNTFTKNPNCIEFLNMQIKSKTSECMRECIRDITF